VDVYAAGSGADIDRPLLANRQRHRPNVLTSRHINNFYPTLRTADCRARRLDDIALKGARPALGGDRAAVRSTRSHY
jgi:hypothetical protein